MAAFQKGDRVRLTQIAKDRKIHKRNPDRVGTVTNNPRGATVEVTWDGQSPKTRTTYHSDFIEKVIPYDDD